MNLENIKLRLDVMLKTKTNGHTTIDDFSIIPRLPLQEELDVGDNEELNKVLKEISYQLRDIREDIGKKQNGASKNTIAAIVGIVGVVLICAAYVANISGDKRALEIKVETTIQDNMKLWQLEETQRLRIDKLEKDIAVDNAKKNR
jgi:hypothetical protein